MASADDQIAKLAEQQAGATKAASAYAAMAAAAQSLMGAVAGLGGSFDAASGRFRAANGQFQSGVSVAQAAAMKVGEGAKYIVAAGTMAAAAITALGKGFVSLATGPVPGAMGAMSAFGNAAGGMISGAGAALNTGLSAIGDKLSTMGPQGAAAGAALKILGASAEAATAALGATVGTLTTLMGLAIQITQKTALMHERFLGLAGGAAGAKAVEGIVAKLSAQLPFASSQVAEWAQQLLVAGLNGKELEGAIKAVAAAQALMGEAGAAAAQNMIQKLAMGGAAADKLMKDIQAGGRRSAQALLDMGLNMRDVAKAAGMSEEQFKKAHLSADQMRQAIEKALAQKGGGALAQMGLTFEAILTKAQEGLRSIFGKLGPAVKPFMQAIKELFSQFNKGTPIIKALQKIATEAFGTLFKYATMAVKAVSAFIKENGTAKNISGIWKTISTVIGMVALYFKILWAVLKPILGSPLVLKGLIFVLKAIAVVAGIVLTVIGALAGIVFVLVAAFAGAIARVFGFVAAIWAAVSAAIGAASGLGQALMQGIMSFDFSAFVAKMSQMAQAGIAAFKQALGIASPSKVMAEMGGHTVAGFTQGVDKNADDAQASMAAMVDPKALKSKAKGIKAGGGSKIVYLEVHAGAEGLAEQIRNVLRGEFEIETLGGEEGAPA